MAENEQEAQQESTQEVETSEAAPNIADPNDAIKELRVENKKRRLNEQKLQEELESFKTAQKEQEEAALSEQGKYQELHEKSKTELATLKLDYKTLEAERDQLKATLEELTQAQLKAIPEQYRELLEGLPVANQLAWITKNAGKLNARLPSFGPSGDNSPLTDKDRIQDIRRRQGSISPIG